MNELEIGLFINPHSDTKRAVELVKLAEDVGLSFVGIADSQMLYDDVYVLLAAAGMQTNRIRLGPWVTNGLTRHETVTVNAICSLNNLTEGRAFLGIGYGDSAVKTIGLRPNRLAELVESVHRMKALARGETVETEDGTWRLETARPELFVYWAADGPKSLQDAGRYADGVIANGLLVREHMDYMKEHIAKGASSVGRSIDDIEIVFNSGICIDRDSRRAHDRAKPYLARTLCHDVSRWMPGWTDEKTREFRAKYDYYHHVKEGHKIAELVPDELVTRKAVAGTPDECAELLRMVVDNGFRHVSLLPLGDVESDIRSLAKDVIPRLNVTGVPASPR